MTSVVMKQNTMTGVEDAFISFAAFCAVRADQIKPPTSASVCAGARTDVSIGCHTALAVPNKFQPRPSGSESRKRNKDIFNFCHRF